MTVVNRDGKVSELQNALNAFDLDQIASVFVLPKVASTSTASGRSTSSSSGKSVSLQDHGLDWSSTLTQYCNASDAALAGDASKMFESQCALHSSFHSVFSSSQGNWLVPTLHMICKMTHKAAIAADRYTSTSASSKDSNAHLQKAVTLLQESYSKTSNDRREFKADAPLDDQEGSKKAGVLKIVNELFAIYFRLNTLRLCKNLLRPVESRKLHQMGKMADMVTYRYYVGRLNLFEDQYQAAEQSLEYALKHCHKNAFENKRRILRYLVPVKLFRGRLPSLQLLEKYGLLEFLPIVEGVRTGDLRLFQGGLVKSQDIFIHRGTYLLLEKCKTVCYRNLFKRIHVITERHQIPLNTVAKSLKWLGMPIDLDEVECILANLIFRGYIRGYLSHAKRVLVLSKRDPFPVSAVIMK
ncbi:PCI domain-containing protein 2 homolog [Seminavis robusta]|uniref:PCI domain-containing protein 2 homolog n=1 Tax=Seminavis robusta TaxID=568900 RepID=A0A9N8H152_9STRA|nr:PCI domain-containing protein 2 homolog [Seminavis robusta]|eukprot:Sro33_g021380.1 PCI domain-containing protein 2 homolog (412) ;mRNA; f:63716-65064